jgi:hypothetical protein
LFFQLYSHNALQLQGITVIGSSNFCVFFIIFKSIGLNISFSYGKYKKLCGSKFDKFSLTKQPLTVNVTAKGGVNKG